MVKKLKNTYDKICTLENLRLAHKNAKKDKAFYKEVKMVNSNEEYYLKQIQDLLVKGEYIIKESDYKISVIYDRIKSRTLMKLDYFPHRIIQWWIMLQLSDMFMKCFSNFSCASIPNRWGKLAMKLMDKYMEDKKWTAYCLKLDIKKFYPSINHSILKKLIRRKIADKKLLGLIDMIIDSHPWDKWIPIWSYLSQYLANYYLTFFDHWLKEELRIKYVIRYMDDIVIFWESKEYLWDIFWKIKEYLDKELYLTIKPNYQVFPTSIRWVDFVGYRFFYWYRLLRKRTCKKFKKKLKHIKDKKDKKQFINYRERASTNSYIGWLIHCNSYRLYSKYIAPIISSIQKYYFFIIGRKNKKKFRLYNKKLLRKKWKINYII